MSIPGLTVCFEVLTIPEFFSQSTITSPPAKGAPQVGPGVRSGSARPLAPSDLIHTSRVGRLVSHTPRNAAEDAVHLDGRFVVGMSVGARIRRSILGEALLSDWGDFAVVMGAATAALLGLLFVAVSIRVETIAQSAELRNRSAQTGALLLTGLLVAALLAVPDQRKWALGAEYFVLAVVVTGVALILDRRAGQQNVSDFGRLLDAHNPTFITCSLLVVAAVILMLGQQDGLYLVVPTLIAVLIGGVVNAWLILVRLPA
jgi:hypothetical protein